MIKKKIQKNIKDLKTGSKTKMTKRQHLKKF